MKPETRFRINHVDPFLETLSNTYGESIQQKAICGTADKILCVRGKFVWLELKDIDEQLRPLQRWKAERVIKAGGIALRADLSNWQIQKVLLQKLDEGDEEWVRSNLNTKI
jgi:hypothetical protein